MYAESERASSAPPADAPAAGRISVEATNVSPPRGPGMRHGRRSRGGWARPHGPRDSAQNGRKTRPGAGGTRAPSLLRWARGELAGKRVRRAVGGDPRPAVRVGAVAPFRGAVVFD